MKILLRDWDACSSFLPKRWGARERDKSYYSNTLIDKSRDELYAFFPHCVFFTASFCPFCLFRKAHILTGPRGFSIAEARGALIYLQRSCLVCKISRGRNPFETVGHISVPTFILAGLFSPVNVCVSSCGR